MVQLAGVHKAGVESESSDQLAGLDDGHPEREREGVPDTAPR